MRTLVSLVAAISALVILPGCSTTQSVTAGPQAKGSDDDSVFDYTWWQVG